MIVRGYMPSLELNILLADLRVSLCVLSLFFNLLLMAYI